MTVEAGVEQNKFLIGLKGPEWTRNMARNRAVYFSDRGRNFTSLLGSREGKPVLLLGPGPSLDMVAPMVGHCYDKDMTVLACNSALNPLAAKGIVPDAVVVLDAEPSIAKQIEEYVAFVPAERLEKMTMIAAATVCPAVIEAWPGPVVFFAHIEYSSPESEVFYRTNARTWEDPDNEDPSKREVMMLGTVACVFNTMIALAELLKASPIWLGGFELPVEIGAAYSATRYDLTQNPPPPVASQMSDVDWKATQRHRNYIACLLRLTQGYVIGTRLVINLSPLASFRDLMLTQNPQSLLTGSVLVPSEAIK